MANSGGTYLRERGLRKLVTDPNKLNIRLPDDPGANPYDSATRPEDMPPKDWQIAGRGWEWWFAVIGIGVVMGLFAYFKART